VEGEGRRRPPGSGMASSLRDGRARAREA
jgi:hypothetical protein